MTAPPPPEPRKPLTLDQQADVIWYLLRRSGAIVDGERLTLPSGDAWLKIDPEMVKDLHAIWRTLRLFHLHRADRFVRDEVAKIGQRRQRG